MLLSCSCSYLADNYIYLKRNIKLGEKHLKTVISTSVLSKYYGKGGEIKAVDELDLKVYDDETFGMLGTARRVARIVREAQRIQVPRVHGSPLRCS